MRQHTEGMVGSITWVLLEIYLAFQQWKNFENPLRIDKPIAMSLVCNFFAATRYLALCCTISIFELSDIEEDHDLEI